MNETTKNPNWEQETMQKVLLETIKEQKRKRRWNIFFKLVYLSIFFIVIFTVWRSPDITATSVTAKPHVGLVDLSGVMMANSQSNADNVVTGLTRAFKDPKTIAVILRINSPGGSPVQASYIYNSIMRLRKQHPDVKIYAVCTDICASAAYYVASAADDVYANQMSIVGSIGAMLNGFGFVGTMEKLGVERRLIISGSEKGFLDPFSPLKPDDVKYAQQMVDLVHQKFIDDVKNGRGNRLSNNPELFSGLAWTGEQAKSLGLIDGFGSAGDVARDVIHNDKIVNYTKKPNLFEQFGFSIGETFFHAFATEFGLNGDVLR